MKKGALAICLGLLLIGCNSDPLEEIKSGKINESSSLTWGQAAEDFSYCQAGTGQWTLVEENRDDMTRATFTCSLNDKSITPYNQELERLAKQEFTNENQRIQNSIRDYAARRDAFRQQFKETYEVQCQGCTILDGITDTDIDALALSYYQDSNSQEPVIKALKDKLVMLDAAFWNLGETLHKLSEVKEATPSDFNALTEINYTLKVTHWLDERRIQRQGEFESSEEINLTFADGETERDSNPINANYIVENLNPTGMISKSYSTSRGIFSN